MEHRNTFPALTALKGIFILVIAFHNSMLVQPLFDAVPGVAFLSLFGGALGNSIFFVLSGFCMACGYRDKIASHGISFRDFLWRRLKKLYPLYLITNIVSIFLDTVMYGMSAVNLEKIASTFLLKLGGGLRTEGPYNAPTWFLCSLFFCYVVFFFCCYHAKTPTRYWCGITLGIVLGHFLAHSESPLPFCSVSNGVGMMNFFVGCALAQVYPLIRPNAHKWAVPLSFTLLLFSFYLFMAYGTGIICGDVSAAFALVIAPLTVYLALAGGLCSRILRWRPLVFLGKISSSIFFWHLVLFYAFRILLQMFAPGQVIREAHYFLYFAIMILWSTASHVLSERLSRR